MSDELDTYIKELRKRPMERDPKRPSAAPLSGQEKIQLIKDKPGLIVETGAALNLERTRADNLQRLRKDCGWSYEDLALQVDLDKKLVIGHLKHGKGLQPETLGKYARAFSDWLNRKILPADLEL